MDVVIEGNCYLSGRFERVCIGITEGRIARIAKSLEGDKVYRFENKMVLPAAIDAHVHFREPGMTHKEDFATGSLAALHGGVTCAFDMPNTRPHTTTVEALKEKRDFASSKSLVDFGLFAGIAKGVDVPALSKGAIGFKLYMGGTTGDMLVPSLDSVKPELEAVAATKKVLAVHAEDERLRKKEPEKDLNDHLRNRVNECETSAIRRLRESAKEKRIHICHVSAKDSLALIGNGFTSEVTPHHLLLDKDARLGAMGKVNPPLRRREDRQALFMALKQGAFDIIASDHAPHTIEEKQEDFEYAPSGMPGVETMAPLMLDLVRKKHLSIDDVVRRICERPAEIHGVRKGKISIGYHGDLMVVDLDSPKMIKADMLHSRCGWTAFEGMSGVFPSAVFLRGQLMLDREDQVGERNGRDVVDQATESR
jgi:dihydroorotase